MKEERIIPLKNYVILAITLILSIILVVYFYMWHNEFMSNRVYTPVLDDYLSVVNYNELDDYLVENKNVALYISVLDNDQTRNFEKKFKNVINEYLLNDNLLYMDLSKEKNDINLYNSIVNKYQLKDLPCIVIFKNGVIDDVYSVDNTDYDIDLLVSYLKIVGVIDD